MSDAISYARANHDRFLAEYNELLSIPSVSTLPEHKADVERTAAWLADHLKCLGLNEVAIVATAGHPVVYAEWLGAPGKPTVLVYGHYDVQPVDPIDEWESPPFEPTIRGDNIYARGASDMKGQLFANLKALEALAQEGPFPVNLKFMLEGEEEIGSPHLAGFVESHREKLTCDAILNCDAGIHRPDLPGIVYGLRGLAYFELTIRTAKKDLHSGLFGGTVPNPAHVLCEVIAAMHDSDGRVTLPGFYDDVRDLSADERDALARFPHSDEDWKAMAGAKSLLGEKGYTTVERVGARPTLDVNGMVSGFTGTGAKTVLPAKAMAKISMRLVPDQQPLRVREQFTEFLTRTVPEIVDWELHEHSAAPAAIMARDSAAMRAAQDALKTVFGKDPVFKREGGSVPVVSLLQNTLGVDSVMLGFALPDDGIHGPNEKQHLPTWFKGIETYIHFLKKL